VFERLHEMVVVNRLRQVHMLPLCDRTSSST
jgi:hypothetical protein